MRSISIYTVLILVLTASFTVQSVQSAPPVKSPLEFTMKNITGENIELESYKGNVILMVNVASQCGLTPQYEQLQAVYEKYRDKNFVVLGFPANEFGSQEPGTDKEILEFCTTNFNVSFPMFSKIVVKGEGIHDLYAFLTGEDTNPGMAGEIKWNFTKFLIDRNGKVVSRFEPKTKPDDPEVVKAIEAALK